MAKDISPKNPSKGKKGDKGKKDREQDRKTGAVKRPGGTSASIVAKPSIPDIPFPKP